MYIAHTQIPCTFHALITSFRVKSTQTLKDFEIVTEYHRISRADNFFLEKKAKFVQKLQAIAHSMRSITSKKWISE